MSGLMVLFFVSGEGGEITRAQRAIMWASGRERLQRAWSNSIGERLATVFLSAAFALVWAMVGSRDLVFGFFLVVHGMLLRRLISLGSGSLPLPGGLSGVERRGLRLRVAGFGVSEVDVIAVD